MMSRSPDIVSIISLTIVVVTVGDTVVAPQAKLDRYSRASDRMWVFQIQALGKYDRHKDRIEEVLATEKGELDLINDLRSMLSERPSTAAAGKWLKSVVRPMPRP